MKCEEEEEEKDTNMLLSLRRRRKGHYHASLSLSLSMFIYKFIICCAVMFMHACSLQKKILQFFKRKSAFVCEERKAEKTINQSCGWLKFRGLSLIHKRERERERKQKNPNLYKTPFS